MTGLWLVSYIVLWVLVLLNLLLIIALARRTAHLPVFRHFEALKVGMPAPPMTAKSLHDNKEVNLETYAGKEVAFVFISANCQPCHEMMPTLLDEVQPLTRQLGIELVLVSDSDVVDLQSFVEKHQLSLPLLLAPRSESKFMEDYKVSGTPFFCLVDSQGVVKAAGPLDPNLSNLTTHFQHGEDRRELKIVGQSHMSLG